MLDNRCHYCKYFGFHSSPLMSWKERFESLQKKHPTLSEEEVKILADDREICEQIQSDYGTCKNKSLPELRDIEFNSKTFGCIYFKK